MASHKRLITAFLTAALLLLGLGATTASASTTQQTILTDPNLYGGSATTLVAQAKAFGFTTVKIPVQWNNAVPNAHSTTEPAAFKTAPTSVSSYLPGFFATLSATVAEANKLGISVIFEFNGPGPVWAQSSSAPSTYKSAAYFNGGTWEPNDTLFADFVKTVAAAYPTVKAYSVWNEPNYGTNLAPGFIGKTNEGAILYRGLLNAAYSGLKAAGKTSHNSTILIGELAPRYQGGPANLAGERPLQFLDNLYGVSTTGKRLTGSAAKTYGVQASASAFRAANPLLFSNEGIANHPYAQGVAPNVPTYTCSGGACQNPKTKKYDPYFSDLASISRLEATADRDNRADGSGTKEAIWNTEFGYSYTGGGLKTCHGSAADCAVPIATAAYYDNWAEYVSYENPRIASFDQYQLKQPTGGATFADGLLSPSGKSTALLTAFEVPLFAPTTTLSKAGNLSLWGGVRPAIYDALTFHIAKTVQIEYAPKGGAYKTLKTVTLSSSRGYFTAKVPVSKSGTLKLVYGSGAAAITSRTQAITVK